MNFTRALLVTMLASAVHTNCYAGSCTCEDWVGKRGYCVDYINDRIPSFPIPSKNDMPSLKNNDVANISEGDVAIFAIKNYWHVAYVENVDRNANGQATAIDVSEMNFGDEMSFPEFKTKWKSKSRGEWDRALCCGVTENFDRVTWRDNIPLSTVKQVWSPDDVAPQGGRLQRVKSVIKEVRQAINRFIERTDGEL